MTKKPIDFVKVLYEFKPDIDNLKILNLLSVMFSESSNVIQCSWYPSAKSLSVWKARLRKRGVYIPDRRRKDKPK
jgi:hypothetical protein